MSIDHKKQCRGHGPGTEIVTNKLNHPNEQVQFIDACHQI